MPSALVAMVSTIGLGAFIASLGGYMAWRPEAAARAMTAKDGTLPGRRFLRVTGFILVPGGIAIAAIGVDALLNR